MYLEAMMQINYSYMGMLVVDARYTVVIPGMVQCSMVLFVFAAAP